MLYTVNRKNATKNQVVKKAVKCFINNWNLKD